MALNWRAAFPWALFALAYYISAQFGLELAVLDESASPVWPATGIAIAGLVFLGLRAWPLLAVLVFLVELPIFGVLGSVILTVGTTLEAVAGAYFIRRIGGPALFRITKRVWLFVGIVALVPIASALGGAIVLWMQGAETPLQTLFATWYFANFVGALIVTPAILLAPGAAKSWDFERTARERAMYIGVFVGLAIVAFAPWQNGMGAPEALTLGLLPIIWSATRFGARASSWSTVALLGLFLLGLGVGTLPQPADPNAYLIQIQLGAAAFNVAGLFTAAVMYERQEAIRSLDVLRAGLEREVRYRTAELQDSMRDLREAQRLAHVANWRYAPGEPLELAPELAGWLSVAPQVPLHAARAMLDLTDQDIAEIQGQMAQDAFVRRRVKTVGVEPERHLEIRGARGDDGVWRGTAQDVTDHARGEQASMHLASLVEFSPLAITSSTPDGEILSWNPAAETLYGYAREEIENHKLDDLLVPRDRFDEMQEARRSLQEGADSVHLQTERLHKSGQIRAVALTIMALRDEHGRLERIAGISWDRSADVQAEKLRHENTEAQHQLEALQKMNAVKTEFLNTASHELRTPLTPILMQLHMLERQQLGPLSPRQERALRVMGRNMRRLSGLVSDLLASAKLQRANMELDVSHVDPASLLHECAISFEAQAKEHRIQLVIEGEGEPPFMADANRLTQVFFNLLSNALKFAPDGSDIRLKTWRERGNVCFMIEDQGPGIAPQERDAIFEPFVQLEEGMTKQGTGLGLYIARQIAQLHGGRIEVHSGAEGTGTRMIVRLPGRPPRGEHVVSDPDVMATAQAP